MVLYSHRTSPSWETWIETLIELLFKFCGEELPAFFILSKYWREVKIAVHDFLSIQGLVNRSPVCRHIGRADSQEAEFSRAKPKVFMNVKFILY